MMSSISNATRTLRQIRDGVGFSAQKVADRVAEILHEPSRTGASIINIEVRGTRDHYVISALAEVLGVTTEEMAAATRPSANENNLA